VGEGWDYKKMITLVPATTAANYQVKIELTLANFDYGHAQANGEDLRFYDEGENSLDYWIEDWSVVGTSTVWVKVAFSGTGKIYMYYGNALAASAASRDDVFDPLLAGTYVVSHNNANIAPNHGATCDGTNFYISNSGFVNKFDLNWSYIQQYGGLDMYTGICWDKKNNRFYCIDWSNKQWSAFDTNFVEFSTAGLHDMPMGNEPIDCDTDGVYLYTNHRNGAIRRNRISDNVQDSINMDALAGFDWGGQGLTMAFGYLFAGTSTYGANSNRIYMVDISNWGTPEIKGYWSGAGHEFNEVAGLAHKGRYIYQTDRDADYAIQWTGPVKITLTDPVVTVGAETPAISGMSKLGAYGIGANEDTAIATINDLTISTPVVAGWNHIVPAG